MRIPMTDAEGVAVRSCARDPPDANAASGTGHVFDNDGLAERGVHMIRQDARERIRWPTLPKAFLALRSVRAAAAARAVSGREPG